VVVVVVVVVVVEPAAVAAFCCCICINCCAMLSGVLGALVVLPGGGGFGASTMPCAGCAAVDGVGIMSLDTEFVVGSVAAVGDVFDGLPSGLFNGWGTLGGMEVEGGGFSGACAWPAKPTRGAGCCCCCG